MPLLTSPIDGSPMKEIERYGIKLDLCPTSGGIWFDKGEVEKLIHFVREETIKEMSDDEAGAPAFELDERKRHDRDMHSVRHDRKRHKRENPLTELLEIFEF